MSHFLNEPLRPNKPRSFGMTSLIDNGIPDRLFEDIIESYHPLIDFVKFGWGCCLLMPNLSRKIATLKKHQVQHHFGGTFFEKSVFQNRLDAYVDFCKKYECEYIEISNGTIEITNSEKGAYITRLKKEFKILSEVGYKDPVRSSLLSTDDWLSFIEQDLSAGAEKVIIEARESGKSGICTAEGTVKAGILQHLQNSSIPIESLVFEAPNKSLQTYFISEVGSNVNLANIPFQDIVGLETLRLGLRSDTFLSIEAQLSKISPSS